jgi:hypothetical protein
MNEHSTTLLPGASKHVPHVEGGVEPLTIEEEALRANEEAERQSTRPCRTMSARTFDALAQGRTLDELVEDPRLGHLLKQVDEETTKYIQGLVTRGLL